MSARVVRRIVLAAALLTLPCTVLAAGTQPAPAASREYIVILREGVSVQAHLKALKITPNRVYQYAANGYQALLNDTQYERALSSNEVLILTPNESFPAGFEPMAKTEPAQPPQSPSNGVKRIGGLLSPTAAIDGVDTRVSIDVAVVDSGVDAAHPDLNVVGGVDCTGTNRGAFLDKAGHGTMVAGFVGAIDNAIGRVGVAPGARIWSVRVANAGYITDAALLCAVDWVTANASTIEIANLSLGGPLRTKQQTEDCGLAAKKVNGDPLHAAICRSVAAGVTYVVSAGNDSVDARTIAPAHYDEVITVSAMGDFDGAPDGSAATPPDCPPVADDTFAFFSNFGADVDLAAPGVCIGSTYPGGLYAINSGTSFSAPLVAGAAALYLSTHPDASPADVRAGLIAAAERGPIPGDPDNFPEGIVNVSGF